MNTQPTVSPEFKILAVAHDHNGLKIDLYGEQDDDGYMVCDVTLTGSTVSLFEITDCKFRDDLSNWCDDNLPCWEEVSRDAQQNARAAVDESYAAAWVSASAAMYK